MFSKAAKDAGKASAKIEALPAPTAKAPPKTPSLIAEHVTLEGSLGGDGELHLDGTIRGDVRVVKLTIGDTGYVEGTIIAEQVEVRGRVAGAISAKQVRLHSSAHVDGDITHEQLSIETGAFFEGRSLKFQRPAEPRLAVAEAPLKRVEATGG